MDDPSDSLGFYHYGVKGMRWGVRKDYKQQRRERKAQKYEAKALGAQKRIETNPNTANARLHRIRDQALRDAESVRSGRLTTKQKRVLVGAAVVGTLIAAKVISNSIDSGQARTLINKGKDFLANTDEFTRLKRNDSLAQKDLSPDELFLRNVRGVNPGYGSPGTVANCRRTTMAYEMRRRGYDVVATRSKSGTGQNTYAQDRALGRRGRALRETIARLASGESSDSLARVMPLGDNEIKLGKTGSEASRSVFSALSKQPNGARGELGVSWVPGGAHSLAWEIARGKPVVFDVQSGKKYEKTEELQRLFGTDGDKSRVSGAAFTRFDDKPIDLDFVRRWVKNA